MPKLSQYKQQQTEAIEQFIYSFELSTCFNPEFSRWLFYELCNIRDWNKHMCFLHAALKTVHMNGQWRIWILENYRIRIECNKRITHLRKGLKINAKNQQLIIT